MKKSIIALAVAAASLAGVAQADNTTLYGSVRMQVNVSDAGDSSVKIKNAGSRWGIKGSDDINNGLTAFYRFEWAAKVQNATSSVQKMVDGKPVLDKDGKPVMIDVHNHLSDGEGLTTRLGFVGLKGGFGSISLGRQWSSYYMTVAGYNDLFNSTYYSFYQGVFRLSNSIAYSTPDMGGFKAEAALILDGAEAYDALGNSSDDVLDAYNVSLSYDNNGIFAGVSYLSTNGVESDEDTRLAAALGYSNDMFRVGLVAERTDNGSDANPLHLSLAGEYYLSDMDTIRLGVAALDSDVDGADEAMEAAIGYEHKLSKRTKVWAEYSYLDSGVEGADDVNNLYFGLRTDF